MSNLIYGVGIYERGFVVNSPIPGMAKAYKTWNGMLERGTEQYTLRRPSYAGTTIAAPFHRFTDFAEWMMAQIGWDAAGFQIDKDLLSKGNKVYAPEFCVFVPLAINSLLTKRASMRGDCPIGVTFDGRVKRYRADCTVDNKTQWLGHFDDPIAAFHAYKEVKEAHIKRVAERFRPTIDPRAFSALMAYQVEITD